MFNECKYVISAVSKKQFPNENNLNEFVFVGRSNVGKSSFINALTNRKMLAKTSSKPGKTRAINFFLIDQKMYLVDLPGYGYASHSQSTRESFGNYIEEYLTDNSNLKAVFLLLDTKVGPTKDDVLMYEYLKYLNLNIVVVGTKSDKVGSTQLLKQAKNISNILNLPLNNVILTSSEKKNGFDKIIAIISSFE